MENETRGRGMRATHTSRRDELERVRNGIICVRFDGLLLFSTGDMGCNRSELERRVDLRESHRNHNSLYSPEYSLC